MFDDDDDDDDGGGLGNQLADSFRQPQLSLSASHSPHLRLSFSLNLPLSSSVTPLVHLRL